MYRVFSGRLGSYWDKPKVAPVVSVSSPEAEEYIRKRFWYQHPVFIREWKKKTFELRGVF